MMSEAGNAVINALRKHGKRRETTLSVALKNAVDQHAATNAPGVAYMAEALPAQLATEQE